MKSSGFYRSGKDGRIPRACWPLQRLLRAEAGLAVVVVVVVSDIPEPLLYPIKQ